LTVSETQIVIRNEMVSRLFKLVVERLNDFCKEDQFTLEELLLAFNQIMMTERDIKNYYSTMR